jgi:hypothetical protein
MRAGFRASGLALGTTSHSPGLLFRAASPTARHGTRLTLRQTTGGAVLKTTASRKQPDKKEAAQLRRPYYCNFGGCSSPLIKACISDNRIGSTRSHWTHWNLRPPVFKAMKCIGLRHFGQVGVGRFSAMTLTLDSGASHTELTVAGDAEERDGDGRRFEPVPFDCLYGPRLGRSAPLT